MFGSFIAYLDSVKARDPAPRSRAEILLYPGVWALFWHRIAHRLFRARLFFLARAINHLSRFLTGNDIHPGATIGSNQSTSSCPSAEVIWSARRSAFHRRRTSAGALFAG